MYFAVETRKIPTFSCLHEHIWLTRVKHVKSFHFSQDLPSFVCFFFSAFVSKAGRFRRLTGTMSPPDDSNTAEIYVEGNRKMVDGFVRWCNKCNVGLSQVVMVTEVIEADPTGLYDAFYCKTR